MRILLIQPNYRRIYAYAKKKEITPIFPPLGLAYIAAVLKEKDIDVEILEANAHDLNHENIKKYVEECSPDFVGITSTTSLIEEAHEKYPQAGVIGGDVIDADGRLFLSQIADAATFPHHNTVCEVRNVPGVNSSYKKEAIEQIGKYDTTLFRGEDVDYNWRAIKNGWKVIYLPDIKVLHVHRPTWRGLFFQHFMYGRANFLVRSKWPDMYSPYPLKLNSTYSILKWIASWIWFPWIDAYHKAKNMKNEINGFDCLVLGLVNIGNRIGIAVQSNII